MPNFQYVAGDSMASEFATFQALMTGLRIGWTSNPAPNSFGQGEDGVGPFLAINWAYSYNNGSPYFSLTYTAASGPGFVQYYRFNVALLGTVDAAQVVPEIYEGFGLVPYSVWNPYRVVIRDRINQLIALMGGTLVPGSLSSSSVLHAYSYGTRAGTYWGATWSGTYNPTLSEQEMSPKRLTYSWTALVGATDADDGTIGYTAEGGKIGSAQSVVPVVVTQTGTQDAAWGDLVGNLTVLSDTSARNTPGLDVPTHPDDVANPGNQAAPPNTDPPRIFAAGANLPALIAVPTSIALLSSAPALTVVATAALGMVASQIFNSGLIGDLVDWLGWSQGASGPGSALTDGLPQISASCDQTAQAVAALQADVERIADALERIADEVCQDLVADPIRPGLVNAVELASQARSEITLRSHGQVVTCSTGSIEEV